MKAYIQDGYEGLAFPKIKGRKRVSSKIRNAAIVAKVAPQELDDQPEERIHDLIELEAESTGLPYLSLRTRYYHWLKRMAGRGEHIAMELLEALKDAPDVTLFDKSSKGGTRALCLELKTLKGKASKGQRSFSEKVGGTIAKGFSKAQAAIKEFAQ